MTSDKRHEHQSKKFLQKKPPLSINSPVREEKSEKKRLPPVRMSDKNEKSARAGSRGNQRGNLKPNSSKKIPVERAGEGEASLIEERKDEGHKTSAKPVSLHG